MSFRGHLNGSATILKVNDEDGTIPKRQRNSYTHNGHGREVTWMIGFCWSTTCMAAVRRAAEAAVLRRRSLTDEFSQELHHEPDISELVGQQSFSGKAVYFAFREGKRMGKLEERRLYSTLVEQLWKVSSWIRWLSSCFGFALSDSTHAQWSNPFRFSYPTCFRKIGCTPSRHGLGLCDKHVTAAPWTSPLKKPSSIIESSIASFLCAQ